MEEHSWLCSSTCPLTYTRKSVIHIIRQWGGFWDLKQKMFVFLITGLVQSLGRKTDWQAMCEVSLSGFDQMMACWPAFFFLFGEMVTGGWVLLRRIFRVKVVLLHFN